MICSPRRNAQRREVAFVLEEPVGERVEVGRKLRKLVPAPRPALHRRRARVAADTCRVRQLLERLDDLPLQRVRGEQAQQDAEREDEGHLVEAPGGRIPRRPVVDEKREHPRTLRVDLDGVFDIVGLEPEKTHHAMRHAHAVWHRGCRVRENPRRARLR